MVNRINVVLLKIYKEWLNLNLYIYVYTRMRTLCIFFSQPYNASDKQVSLISGEVAVMDCLYRDCLNPF